MVDQLIDALCTAILISLAVLTLDIALTVMSLPAEIPPLTP